MKKLFLLALATSTSAVTTLSAAPVVFANGIVNGASFVKPIFPNGSIAQGSIFSVFGTGLGPAAGLQPGSFPLPTNLGGTSANVTVNGSTLPCIIVYAQDGQVNAILPSTTPTGTGTVVVSYNGTSNAAAIKVVTSSPGIFTVNSQGTGPAVIQDAKGTQNALNFAFNPLQTVVIWATGLGPISGSDANVPPSGNLPGVTVTAFVGGKSALVSYAGRSSSAGEDQVNVALPAGVTGCYVPVYIVVTPNGGAPVTSNIGTVSIAASGAVCSDPGFPNVSGGKGAKTGSVVLSRSSTFISAAGMTLTSNNDNGGGAFIQYDPTQLANASYSYVDITSGSCSVIQVSGTGSSVSSPKNLDAGPAINVTGPNGSKPIPKVTSGGYSSGTSFGSSTSFPGVPSTPLFLDPGNYTLDNGGGGADVGPFKLSLTIPPAFTWTNENAITTVDRTQNLQITWTGGDPNSQVVVTGTSSIDNNTNAVFICYAKDSDLQLTVPSAILSLLPPSAVINGTPGGLLTVSTANQVTGTAPGLDTLTGTFSYAYPKVGITYK